MGGGGGGGHLKHVGLREGEGARVKISDEAGGGGGGSLDNAEATYMYLIPPAPLPHRNEWNL